MEKKCGYVSDNGQFFDNEKDAAISNLEIKVRECHRKVEKLKKEFFHLVRSEWRYIDGELTYGGNDIICNVLDVLLFHRREELVSILYKTEEIEKHIDRYEYKIREFEKIPKYVWWIYHRIRDKIYKFKYDEEE